MSPRVTAPLFWTAVITLPKTSVANGGTFVMSGDMRDHVAPEGNSDSGLNCPDLSGQSASHRLAWLLAILATAMFEMTSADGDRAAWMTVATVIVEVLLAAALSIGFRHIDRAAGTLTKSRLVWVVCLVTGPFVLEILARTWTVAMLPLELQLLSYIRNVVLVLAVFSHREDCRRSCCAMSMYLAIFCSALSTQLWMHGLVVVFAMAGVWWLMTAYWESLQHRLVARNERHLPRQWLIAIPLFLLLALAAVPVTGTPIHALWGFMPSSGGMDRYSETARQGVRDGDALVAGTEHIQSFAPIEDAPFLSSHDPSLYDLFDESYNETVKQQKTDRAIALPAQLGIRQKEQHLADSKQAGREFSTLRKPGPPKPSRVENRDSAALLYVKGRVPLHLRLEVFDLYDGITWFPEPLPMGQGELRMESLNGRPWLRTPVANAIDIYATPESHALKVIHLDTNRVLSPSQLLGIHVDKVDQPEFFTWAQSDIVRLDRDKLPALTVINIQSRVPDERRAPAGYLFLQGGNANHRFYGDGAESERIRDLAQQWTKEISPGWAQIQKIVHRMRTEYEHDRGSRPPADCNHTVGHFLFDGRRGPDYAFASSTVLLLRSLGYSARLISGFYANPSRYEVRSRHTAVLADDVHFWVEVRASARDWIPLEPTPGYELLRPPLTIAEQLQTALFHAWRVIVDYVVALSLCVATLIGLSLQRRAATDWVMTFLWRITPFTDDRDFVRRSMRLLNARASGVGRPRPRGITPTCWLSGLASLGDSDGRSLMRKFTLIADWAAFAPNAAPAPVEFPRDICRNAVRVWSRRRMREVASIGSASEILQPPGPAFQNQIHLLRRDGARLSRGISQ